MAALSAELETPLNVHRWRKLEGTDPAAYELLLKIQARAAWCCCSRYSAFPVLHTPFLGCDSG